MTETMRKAAAAEIVRDVMRVLEVSTWEDGFKGEVDGGLVEDREEEKERERRVVVVVGMEREASEKVESEENKSMEVKK